MTSSKLAVTKRETSSPLVRSMLVIAAFGAVVDTVNVFTTIHDAAEEGDRLALWEPATWEFTSFVATLVSCLIVYQALKLARPGQSSWPKLLAVHVPATIAFSFSHILLMNALGVVIYIGAGHHYSFMGSGFLYEYRKDVISYATIAAIFWLFTRDAEKAAAARPERPQVFDIRDGKRLVRVPIGEIAAVRAAGNYVEFILMDGRRPLSRQPLAMAQQELGPDFVRVHRSWAVNILHVRELRALGAGDYELELAGAIKAPLSRRFPEALAKLRTPR